MAILLVISDENGAISISSWVSAFYRAFLAHTINSTEVPTILYSFLFMLKIKQEGQLSLFKLPDLPQIKQGSQLFFKALLVHSEKSISSFESGFFRAFLAHNKH